MQIESNTGLEPSRRNSVRNRKALIVGFSLSALLHAVILFGWRAPGLDLEGSLAAGPRAGDYRAAAGGGEILAIAIAPPRPIEIPAPPAEVLLTDLNVVTDEPERSIQPVELAGPSGGAALISDRSGPGLVGGEGRGDSGNSAEGSDRNSLAIPRSIVPRIDAPQEMQGMSITIRVEVDARGEPTGAITFEPSIPHAGFERELREDFLGMDYLPASRNGRAVADWMEMSMSF